MQGIDPEENIKEDKITLPDYEEDSRPSMQKDHENFDEDSKIDSMHNHSYNQFNFDKKKMNKKSFFIDQV